MNNDLIVKKPFYGWQIKVKETDSDQAEEKNYLQDLNQQSHLSHGDEIRQKAISGATCA